MNSEDIRGIRSNIPIFDDYCNVDFEIYRKMALEKLEEAEDILIEKILAVNQELDKLKSNINRKYRSIDEPFEPSIGEN